MRLLPPHLPQLPRPGYCVKPIARRLASATMSYCLSPRATHQGGLCPRAPLIVLHRHIYINTNALPRQHSTTFTPLHAVLQPGLLISPSSASRRLKAILVALSADRTLQMFSSSSTLIITTARPGVSSLVFVYFIRWMNFYSTSPAFKAVSTSVQI
jgi:hypothetical protein